MRFARPRVCPKERGLMKMTFRNQFMVFAGSLVLAACAGPGAVPNEEPAKPTGERPIADPVPPEAKPDPEA